MSKHDDFLPFKRLPEKVPKIEVFDDHGLVEKDFVFAALTVLHFFFFSASEYLEFDQSDVKT